jgi:Na+/H+-dicarboxylate symporter
VALGAAVGIALGLWLGPGPTRFGFDATSLSDVGLLVVRVLKLLATPLILFSVLDAMLSSEVRLKSARTLFGISAVNALVALTIALGCASWLESGRGQFPSLRAEAGEHATVTGEARVSAFKLPQPALAALLPENVIEPLRENSVIAVVLLAVTFGLALRAVRARGGATEAAQVEAVAVLSKAGLRGCSVALGWVIEAVPFAVAGVLAGAVARAGLGSLRSLAPFLATMLLGLTVHSVVYYGVVLRWVGRRSPLAFFRGMADALLTALSCSSSIATLPVTLRCLERLGVRSTSAQLATSVGTNLNHDGIILYEAAATLFVAQALGLHPSFADQLRIAGASVLAGVGMAGVPEAGLVTLPLVMSAGGIPAGALGAVLPLVLPVDWIIGRFRAATNVASDATVAILLDRFTPAHAAPKSTEA